MTEIWLRSNTRVLSVSYFVLLVGELPISLWLLWLAAQGDSRSHEATVTALALFAAGILLCPIIVWQLRRPRLAYRDRRLLVYLRWVGVIRVPIEFVEGFLLGQGPTFLPGHERRNFETATLVIKLADREEAWARVDVDRTLGSWCQHYVTIRGTWCEPLRVELVNRLNARLSEIAQPAPSPQVAG